MHKANEIKFIQCTSAIDSFVINKNEQFSRE